MTARGRALHRAFLTRGITEQPAGSNSDYRRDGIHAWQLECAGGGAWLVGQPWCGVRLFDLYKHAGVARIGSYLASVSAIEDYARAKAGCFKRGWTTDHKQVLRGDAAVLFGRGIHVEMVREVCNGYLITEGGNTSSGQSGSQDNGGGCYRRIRPFSEVHGYALAHYPS